MIQLTFRMALLGAALAAASSFAILACKGGQTSGDSIANRDALKPDATSFQQCTLELAGTKYKADVKALKNGDNLRIDLRAFDETIEGEEYLSSDKSFAVVDAGGERYDPPIDLARYPMRVGDQWDWKGEIRTGPVGHPAQAHVTTSNEDLAFNGETLHNVLRVDVDLAIDSGIAGQPSKRKLVFEIAPNVGVVKRAFGDYSRRGPVEP